MKSGSVHGDVAIVGIACTYPGARNATTFWQNIINKFSAIAEMDSRRCDAAVFCDPDPTKPDKLYFKQAGMLGASFTFNPLKLGIPPNTIEGSEPDHFLVLRAAYEVLDDAGYLTRPFNRQRTSMILGKGNYLTPGCTWLTLRTVVTESVINMAKSLRPDLSTEDLDRLRTVIRSRMPRLTAENAAGLIPNIVTGRVANRLDFMGRNSTVDAACASSLLATEDAINSLLTYKDDMVITGGVHISTHIPFLSIFHATRAMSETSVIRPFDAKADGTMAGEGVGLLVLKRLEDAEKDGDRIYAVIKGAGSASDGKAKGLMAPRVEGEELAVRRAYAMSRVEPDTVGLVEGHGTATPVGDAAELETLRRVFGPNSDGRRTCALGSVKSNIGHAMPAAGAAGLIKTALALYHRVLPPTLNVRQPHPILQDLSSRFYLNTEARPWVHRNGGAPRRACVNAFGFGGINAHVVLEEHKGPDEMSQPSLLRTWEEEVFVFEGRTRAELIAQMDQVRSYAAEVKTVHLRDLAFTLNTALRNLPQRAAIVASGFEDLVQKIDRVRERLADPECRQIRERQGLYFFDSDELRGGKVGIMFPGEGSQYLNMLKDLCIHFPVVRQAFDQADSTTAGAGATPLSEVLFPPPSFSEEAEALAETQLWSIERATEAVLTADGAAYRLLQQLGVRADVMTGHSGGEWIAMAASGMVDFHEFVAGMPRLARMYRELAANTSIPKMAMLAVGAGKERVEALAREVGVSVRLANDNCPHQVVVVVDPTEANQASEHLLKSGVFVERLPYDRGYHTPAFTYICEPLQEFFQSLHLKQPEIPVFSCTTAVNYGSLDAAQIVESASETFARTLIFQDTIESMYETGVRIFVESGPRGNLTSFVDDILRGRPHLAVPIDQFRRPGLLALQHAVGLLTAAHLDLDMSVLYSRRSPRQLALDVKADTLVPEERQPGAMEISLCYAEFQAPSPEEFRLPELEQILPSRPVPEPVEVPLLPLPQALGLEPEVEAFAPMPQYSEWGGEEIVPQTMLSDHLSLMEQFLETEEQVLTSILGRGQLQQAAVAARDSVALAGEADDASAAPEQMPAHEMPGPALPLRAFPLLQYFEILEETPGESAIIRLPLDLNEHRYLLDHVLSRPSSERNATGGRKANMPLTGSIELICEAATKWFGGRTVTGIQNVTAMRPIFAEEGQPPAQIAIHLRRLDANRVQGTVRSAANEDCCEATVSFADAFPPPASADPLELIRPKQPICRGTDIYDTHRMFHGPCFQGIHAIQSVGENGLVAQLKVLANDQCLRSGASPEYLIDPHLFDAAGQLVGYWPIEYYDTGMILLPIRIAEITRFGESPAPGTILDVRLFIREINERQLRADYDVSLPDGRLWLRVRGWEDWRFHFERRFYDFFRFPDRNLMGRQCALPQLEAQGISCAILDCMADLGKPGLYEMIWTSSLLSVQERERFQSAAGEPARARWLNESGAAKDVVRSWGRRKGRDIYPADVDIRFGPHREIEASGFWEAETGKPFVACSYEGKICAAAAAAQPLTIAAERVVPSAPPPENLFIAEEQEWIQRLAHPDEWLARVIAAKKAVARYLRPHTPENREFWRSLVVLKLDERSGEIVVADPASAVNSEDVIRTFTLREGEWTLAIATE